MRLPVNMAARLTVVALVLLLAEAAVAQETTIVPTIIETPACPEPVNAGKSKCKSNCVVVGMKGEFYSWRNGCPNVCICAAEVSIPPNIVRPTCRCCSTLHDLPLLT